MSPRPAASRSALRWPRSRREVADRYLAPALARCCIPLLERYPAKRHLRALADFLGAEETPSPSDAIIVLGGGTLDRVEAGARLHRLGLAATVYLSTDVDPAPGEVAALT